MTVRSVSATYLLFGSVWTVAFMIALWTVISLYSAPPISAQASPVDLNMTVEKAESTKTNEIYVGDPFIITLSATFPQGHFVIFPTVSSEWCNRTNDNSSSCRDGNQPVFEVRSQSSLPTVDNGDGTLTSSIQIEAVLFTTGQIPTPELSIAIRKPDGEIINRPVSPIDVTVAKVLPGNGDADLKDIKPQAELPVPPDPLSALRDRDELAILAILIGVGIAALAVYLWGLNRRTVYPVLSTPAETALAELDRIEAVPLVSVPDIKEHYVLVSDCLRRYLWGQFDVPAAELTTRQIMQSIESLDIPASERDELARILDECDLVKFARFLPGADDAIGVIRRSREFVRETGVVPDHEQESAAIGAEPA